MDREKQRNRRVNAGLEKDKTHMPEGEVTKKPSICKRCGAAIFWHRSRGGKNYCTNTAEDRSDFHQCEANGTAPAKVEPSLSERVKRLERRFAELVKRSNTEENLNGAQIEDSDIPF